MPFISTWRRTPSTTFSAATASKKAPCAAADKYQYVEEILNAADYYQVLGVSKDASVEDVRRAYIRRSRVCHPDKFVPPYPRATESFQVLSLAYETLSNSTTKLMYDLNTTQSGTGVTVDDDAPNDTLQRVLHQLFVEMMDGEFQTMHAFIHTLNETNPAMRISEDAVLQIELAFRKMRALLLSTHTYYKVIQFDLMRLYELQQELRRLSYFDVWRRMQLSITICKILLQLPIMINTASREKYHQQQQHIKDTPLSEAERRRDHHADGILGPRVENALKMAVHMLEAGERYTGTSS
ncbi:hypothetical protein BX666DRAFT_1963245 [Dichotomocladium elegans]|nr:hypothetical protein BX666DRAFT_1963245 [Dichotomocladium elegans]